MKISAFALPIAVLLFAACTPANTPSDAESSSSTSSADAPPASSASSIDAMTQSSTASEGISVSAAASVSINPSVARIVKIDASDFAFTPNSITVKKGEKIIIRLTSSEGIHGFAVPDLGINQSVAAGESHDITLDTSTTGTFSFRCTVPCGPGHKEMTGTIVIE